MDCPRSLVSKRVLLVFGEQEQPWSAICMIFQRYEQNQEANKSAYFQAISDTIPLHSDKHSLSDLETSDPQTRRQQS
jgi:hypothetical protein